MQPLVQAATHEQCVGKRVREADTMPATDAKTAKPSAPPWPIDWSGMYKEMHDAEAARREAKRTWFAGMAKGIPVLEAHLDAWPTEHSGWAQIGWMTKCDRLLAKLSPRFGKWMDSKANIPNHRFPDYSDQWPDVRENWDDIDELVEAEENNTSLDDVYDNVPEFKRRCDRVWRLQRQEAKAANGRRFKWLMNMAFRRALFAVRLVGAAKWRKWKVNALAATNCAAVAVALAATREKEQEEWDAAFADAWCEEEDTEEDQ